MRVVTLLLGACLGIQAQGTVPRPAPELRIVEGSGKTTLLSAYRGHVVLLAFISTRCGHCQTASLVFERLAQEFAGRLQVAEAAFDEGADPGAFRQRFGLTFPVGALTSGAAHAFLGIAPGTRLGTPQVVAIDPAGVIRAQSERLGTPLLQTHDYLRALIDAICKRETRR
jgi:peroxiredoxin